jgi:hypothetical protein
MYVVKMYIVRNIIDLSSSLCALGTGLYDSFIVESNNGSEDDTY